MGSGGVWERRGWFGGIVFVVALVAETAVSAGLPINQNDSPAKIARALHEHRDLVLIAAYFSAVYAVAFVVYLCTLHDALRRATGERGVLHSLVLVGGALMVAFHAASDVGIYGLLGGKLATYGALHDHGLSYTLYLLTFALDSVGDVFGSAFLLAAGLLIGRSTLLPRWLARISLAAGILLFVQAFGLGGVINTFGLVVDLIGFVLFLLFVLLSSAVALRRGGAAAPAGVVN